jgi:hypothetical protein
MVEVRGSREISRFRRLRLLRPDLAALTVGDGLEKGDRPGDAF